MSAPTSRITRPEERGSISPPPAVPQVAASRPPPPLMSRPLPPPPPPLSPSVGKAINETRDGVAAWGDLEAAPIATPASPIVDAGRPRAAEAVAADAASAAARRRCAAVACTLGLIGLPHTRPAVRPSVTRRGLGRERAAEETALLNPLPAGSRPAAAATVAAGLGPAASPGAGDQDECSGGRRPSGGPARAMEAVGACAMEVADAHSMAPTVDWGGPTSDLPLLPLSGGKWAALDVKSRVRLSRYEAVGTIGVTAVGADKELEEPGAVPSPSSRDAAAAAAVSR